MIEINIWIKKFSYGKKINLILSEKVIGKHVVKFSSEKEIITLDHVAFDRALYSEGALFAKG